MKVVLVYLQLFGRNSPLKCAPQAKIAKRSRNLVAYFGG